MSYVGQDTTTLVTQLEHSVDGNIIGVFDVGSDGSKVAGPSYFTDPNLVAWSGTTSELLPRCVASGGGGVSAGQVSFYPTVVAYATGPGASTSGVPDNNAATYQVDNKPTFVTVSGHPQRGDLIIMMVQKDAQDTWRWV